MTFRRLIRTLVRLYSDLVGYTLSLRIARQCIDVPINMTDYVIKHAVDDSFVFHQKNSESCIQHSPTPVVQYSERPFSYATHL